MSLAYDVAVLLRKHVLHEHEHARSHDETDGREPTRGFLATFRALLRDDAVRAGIDEPAFLTYAEAEALAFRAYAEGYLSIIPTESDTDASWEWPESLPDNEREGYPECVIVDLFHTLGVRDGKRTKNWYAYNQQLEDSE